MEIGKIEKKKATTILIVWQLLTTLLVGYGLVSRQDLERALDSAEVYEALQQSVNSSFSLLQNPPAFIVSKVGSYTCMQSGITGKLEYYNTNSSRVINYAIDNLTSERTWPEVVAIKGNYTLTNSIMLPSFTTIEAQNAYFALGNLADCPGIRNKNYGTGDSHLAVYGGILSGNYGQQTLNISGISFTNVTHATIHAVTTENWTAHGIEIYEGCQDITISQCISQYNGDDGFAVGFYSATGVRPSDVTITGCIGKFQRAAVSTESSGFEVDDGAIRVAITGCIGHNNSGPGVSVHRHTGIPSPQDVMISGGIFSYNGREGISIFGPGLTELTKDVNVVGAVCANNTMSGIRLNYAQNIKVSGVTSEYNKNYGFDFRYANSSSITGSFILGNSQHNIRVYCSSDCIVSGNIIKNAQGSFNGISVEDDGSSPSLRDIISDNRIFDDQSTKTQGYAIRLNQNTDYQTITDNIMLYQKFSPVMVLIGSNNKVYRNVGYVTENSLSGSNTTTTTVVLNHGLAAAATFVWASFNFTGWTSWTWTTTSTQVTITVTGTLPASWTCYVMAEYKP